MTLHSEQPIGFTDKAPYKRSIRSGTGAVGHAVGKGCSAIQRRHPTSADSRHLQAAGPINSLSLRARRAVARRRDAVVVDGLMTVARHGRLGMQAVGKCEDPRGDKMPITSRAASRRNHLICFETDTSRS